MIDESPHHQGTNAAIAILQLAMYQYDMIFKEIQSKMINAHHLLDNTMGQRGDVF